jgi:hypothetical protein
LLNNLVEDYGNRFDEIVTYAKTGNLQRRVMVLIKGSLASYMRELETKIIDGDTVVIVYYTQEDGDNNLLEIDVKQASTNTIQFLIDELIKVSA